MSTFWPASVMIIVVAGIIRCFSGRLVERLFRDTTTGSLFCGRGVLGHGSPSGSRGSAAIGNERDRAKCAAVDDIRYVVAGVSNYSLLLMSIGTALATPDWIGLSYAIMSVIVLTICVFVIDGCGVSGYFERKVLLGMRWVDIMLCMVILLNTGPLLRCVLT